MSATYQCPDCGQVIPVMGLEDGPAPRCPVCRGALGAGPPPEPAAAISTPPARYDDDLPEIDIRRKGLPSAPPARPSANRGARYGWLLVVVGIGLTRACLSSVNRRNDPPLPPIQMPAFQPQWQPNLVMPAIPQPAGLVQRARWEQMLPGRLAPSRLYVSGPVATRVAALMRADLRETPTTLAVFDGATGAPAGKLTWDAPTEVVDVSLSADAARVAVLLQVRDQPATRRLHVLALPAGNEVAKDWLPPMATDPDADLWFAMAGPDLLLTISARRRLEAWAVPDLRRQYAVALEVPVGKLARAAAISPDRQTLAIADRVDGFTFYDTASGAVRGQTIKGPGIVTSVGMPQFSPDGQHLGCRVRRPDREGVAGEWVRWACPGGALVNRWDMPSVRWWFWDDEHVLMNTGNRGEQALRHAADGRITEVLHAGALVQALATSSGRRLWYAVRNPLALRPRSELVAIELPVRALAIDVENWRLDHEGLHRDR